MIQYKWIVWVGGVDEYFRTHTEARRYLKGYDDVYLEENKMPKKPIKIKNKPKDKLIYIYGDEMSDVWEHFNMSVRDDDDRIVLKFVRYESRDSYENK